VVLKKNKARLWIFPAVLLAAVSVVGLAEAQQSKKKKSAKPAAVAQERQTRPRRNASPTPTPLLPAATPAPTPQPDLDKPNDPPPLLVPEEPKPGAPVPTPLPTPQATPTPKPPDNAPQTVDDDEIVVVKTDLTNVLFTAQDKDRRFFSQLKQEDVRVFEDDKPQEIFTFSRQTDLPLSLALLIDTSGSMERTLPAEKEMATEFVNAVIRPSKDEVAVVSFTGEATLEQGMTGNLQRARRAIEKVEFMPPAGYVSGGIIGPGSPPINGNSRAGSTAIWDAIYVTADEILSDTSDKTRRAIILLTDGVDSSSRWKRDEALDRAVKADAAIYCIGIGDEFQYGVDEGTLKKVADKTGGRAYFPRSEEDLRRAFVQIQEELRSQYLLAYSPTNKNRDGSFRRIRLEIANQQLAKDKLKLTYRQGYYAKAR
jgi:VWFA-related protein